jgi:hypothetical protein
MLKYQKEPRPIVFIGNLQGRNEVAISISHLLGALERSPPGDPKARQNIGTNSSRPIGQFRGIDPEPVTARVQPDLVYTHGTLPGSGGSPLFDAETGDLIGIHQMGYPCGQSPEHRSHVCLRHSESITTVVDLLHGRRAKARYQSQSI